MDGSEAKSLCIRTRVKDNDSSSLKLASFQKPSSESNNATREKAGNERAKLFMTNWVFNIELLRLHRSDRDKILNKHNRGIKQSCPEAHDIPRHGSGDLLRDRFCSLEENYS